MFVLIKIIVFYLPGTIFTTPGGNPAFLINSAAFNAVSGVCSAGLQTTVFPHAKQGANLTIKHHKGKFHGIIKPHTPIKQFKVFKKKIFYTTYQLILSQL